VGKSRLRLRMVTAGFRSEDYVSTAYLRLFKRGMWVDDTTEEMR
jgi:hypothetical protein